MATIQMLHGLQGPAYRDMRAGVGRSYRDPATYRRVPGAGLGSVEMVQILSGAPCGCKGGLGYTDANGNEQVGPPAPPATPFYKSGWFWLAVGVAAVVASKE